MAERYMPQELFDFGAATIVRLHLTGHPIESTAHQIADGYKATYADSLASVDDWVKAAIMLLTNVEMKFPKDHPILKDNWESSIAALFRHFQYFRDEFDLDGHRKKKQWLSGTRFVYESAPIPNKVDACLINFAVFDILASRDALPEPPANWRK